MPSTTLTVHEWLFDQIKELAGEEDPHIFMRYMLIVGIEETKRRRQARPPVEINSVSPNQRPQAAPAVNNRSVAFVDDRNDPGHIFKATRPGTCARPRCTLGSYHAGEDIGVIAGRYFHLECFDRIMAQRTVEA